VQIGVQYRLSETNFADYLYASHSPEERLRRLADATAADLIARSGVDYVHPLGLGELRQRMTERVRQLAAEQRLGLEIEEVAVSAVAPPVHVKADFLEVSNARADKDKYINSALAYAEQRRETARAEAQAVLDEAAIYREQTVEAAKGSADRFTSLVAQFRRHESEGGSYVAARRMALRREYLTTMQEILRNVAGKVLLDSGKPVDLTILRDPSE
jgi:membrane protease subunit HflK